MDCHNCGTLPRHLHTAMYRWLRRTTKPIRCLRAPIFSLSYVPIVLLVFCTANTKWFWGKTLKRRFLQTNQKWKWLWVERLTTVGKKTHLTFNCTEVKSTNTERLKTRRGARKKRTEQWNHLPSKGNKPSHYVRECVHRDSTYSFSANEWLVALHLIPLLKRQHCFPISVLPPPHSALSHSFESDDKTSCTMAIRSENRVCGSHGKQACMFGQIQHTRENGFERIQHKTTLESAELNQGSIVSLCRWAYSPFADKAQLHRNNSVMTCVFSNRLILGHYHLVDNMVRTEALHKRVNTPMDQHLPDSDPTWRKHCP